MALRMMIRYLIALTVVLQASFAVVTPSPSICNSIYIPFPKEQDVQQPISLRVRSTKEADLDGIIHILALAFIDPYDQERNVMMNFRLKIEMLKAKAGYSTILHSRLQAVQTGIKMAAKWEQELQDSDNLRRMWSNDGFRNKVEKAARLSNEPHVWTRHNFAYAPERAHWLQHKMFTAEDKITGQVIGYCEVAMLSDPTGKGEKDALPTIANLAILPQYRRRGIASRLVRSASRFVLQKWNFDTISLFVAKENGPALFMYSNLGKSIAIEPSDHDVSPILL
jgi:ribosomal protein S18 acetylase RimI-like enzyme